MAYISFTYVAFGWRCISYACHEILCTIVGTGKELMRIAGINQAIQSICNIGGPALGAILLLAFDMSLVMLLDVLGAIIACTALLFVYIPNP